MTGAADKDYNEKVIKFKLADDTEYTLTYEVKEDKVIKSETLEVKLAEKKELFLEVTSIEKIDYKSYNKPKWAKAKKQTEENSVFLKEAADMEKCWSKQLKITKPNEMEVKFQNRKDKKCEAKEVTIVCNDVKEEAYKDKKTIVLVETADPKRSFTLNYSRVKNEKKKYIKFL